MATRRAIAAALLKQLTSGGQFYKQGRRDRAAEQAASPNKPAIYLIKPREKYVYGSDDEQGIPPIRRMHFIAIVYTDIGSDETAVPADIIDDLLDALDTALQPNAFDQLANGNRQTLGGLVYSARIDGDVEFGPNDIQGKGMTLVPIEVVLP